MTVSVVFILVLSGQRIGVNGWGVGRDFDHKFTGRGGQLALSVDILSHFITFVALRSDLWFHIIYPLL